MDVTCLVYSIIDNLCIVFSKFYLYNCNRTCKFSLKSKVYFLKYTSEDTVWTKYQNPNITINNKVLFYSWEYMRPWNSWC
jgi:hypothetical protein